MFFMRNSNVFWLICVEIVILSFHCCLGGQDCDSAKQDDAGGHNKYTDTGTDASSSCDEDDQIGGKLKHPEFDQNGYILFCNCMGNVGNQVDQLIGALAFAKELNRTLIIPPIVYFGFVPFTDWFQFEPMLDYHRVISMDDFMKYIAPEHWPPSKRLAFCWRMRKSDSKECPMSRGDPMASFWKHLQVEFVSSVFYSDYIGITSDGDAWNKEVPASKYPVLTFRGAPAYYPMLPDHRHIQRYIAVEESLQQEAHAYIEDHFPGEKFVAIHLRNAKDWDRVCATVDGLTKYMSSPQCLEGTHRKVTTAMCLPPLKEILRLTRQAVVSTRAKVVFVGTDKNPMIDEIEEGLREYQVKVYRMKPRLAVIDLVIMSMSDHFIGNCISSFTAYVKRARDLDGKPTTFWGFS